MAKRADVRGRGMVMASGIKKVVIHMNNGERLALLRQWTYTYINGDLVLIGRMPQQKLEVRRPKKARRKKTK